MLLMSNKNLLLFLVAEAPGFLRIESEGGDSVKGYRTLGRAYWTSLQCSKRFRKLRLCCEIGHGSPMGPYATINHFRVETLTPFVKLDPLKRYQIPPQSFSFPLPSSLSLSLSLSLSCSKSVLHLEAFTQLADLLESQLPRVCTYFVTLIAVFN